MKGAIADKRRIVLLGAARTRRRRPGPRHRRRPRRLRPTPGHDRPLRPRPLRDDRLPDRLGREPRRRPRHRPHPRRPRTRRGLRASDTPPGRRTGRSVRDRADGDPEAMVKGVSGPFSEHTLAGLTGNHDRSHRWSLYRCPNRRFVHCGGGRPCGHQGPCTSGARLAAVRRLVCRFRSSWVPGRDAPSREGCNGDVLPLAQSGPAGDRPGSGRRGGGRGTAPADPGRGHQARCSGDRRP